MRYFDFSDSWYHDIRLSSIGDYAEALLSLYHYHLTDDEKQWIARQLTTDMADLRKSK